MYSSAEVCKIKGTFVLKNVMADGSKQQEGIEAIPLLPQKKFSAV
jgi:hypothetical protein